MATKRISQLDTQATANETDLFEVAIVDANSASGYASKKESAAAIADAIVGEYQYPLRITGTTAKTIAALLLASAVSFTAFAHHHLKHNGPPPVYRPHAIPPPPRPAMRFPLVIAPAVPSPMIPVQPPPPMHRVWVQGYYVQELNQYGSIVQRWIPGHWEYR